MTVEKFRDTVELWLVNRKSAGDVVFAACDLLLEGVDGPAVSRLAAVSVNDADEVFVALEDAMRELGLEHHDRGTDAAKEAGLRAMARQVLAGDLPPRELTKWVHRTCGHDKLALAEELAVLDDVYDEREMTGVDPRDVDEMVLAEARRLTA